jgi:hypothetical protein
MYEIITVRGGYKVCWGPIPAGLEQFAKVASERKVTRVSRELLAAQTSRVPFMATVAQPRPAASETPAFVLSA